MKPSTFKIKTDVLSKYTVAGFTLFPCDGYSKKALHRGFQKLPYSLEVNFKDRNYGVLLSRRFFVIDVDKRGFQPETDKPLTRLFEDLKLPKKILKSTFQVKTPSGGYHIYFAKHPGVRIRGSLQNYPGLEFKEHFITAAGSYNEELDINYEILNLSPSHIEKCPERLLAYLARKDEIVLTDSEHLTNHPTNVSKFTQLCASTEAAIEGQNGEPKTFRLAATGKDYGLSWEKTRDIIAEHFNPRCQPEWAPDELSDKVRGAYEYGYKPTGCKSIEHEFDDLPAKPKSVESPLKVRGWDLNPNKTFKKTLHNVVQLLTWDNPKDPDRKPLLKNKLKFNLFTNRVEFTQYPPWRKTSPFWTDDDARHVKYHLSFHYKFDPPMGDIHDAAVTIASSNAYHPVRDYVRGLTWDQVPRIDSWLSRICGAEDSPLNRFYARKTLIAAITRVFRPGCKFDHVLVLEGVQGIGKSFLCHILADPWFTDAQFDVRNKDTIDLIQGNWIIELAEMYSVSRAENKAMKQFITTRVDRCRPAYGRSTIDYPRQCVFIGTTNVYNEGYLKDQENRRFWPVSIKEVDLDMLKAERDQLWAEAYMAYMKGEDIHVHDVSIAKMSADAVSERQLVDPWESLISSWLDEQFFTYYNERRKGSIIYPIDVYVNCIGGAPTSFSPRESSRIAGILLKNGFFRRRERKPGERNIYFIKTLDRYEI